MQIVIDIDDNTYTHLFDSGMEIVPQVGEILLAVKNGTVLPKEHGDLKDVLDIEWYKFNIWDKGPDYEDLVDMDDIYNNVPTIVKGNIEKEEEE